LQKGTEDSILEFAKIMDDRWSKLREPLQKVSSEKWLTTETQSDSIEEVLVYGETNNSALKWLTTETQSDRH